MLLNFLPLVKAVPVLPELCVRQSAAATMFQVTFKTPWAAGVYTRSLFLADRCFS